MDPAEYDEGFDCPFKYILNSPPSATEQTCTQVPAVKKAAVLTVEPPTPVAALYQLALMAPDVADVWYMPILPPGHPDARSNTLSPVLPETPAPSIYHAHTEKAVVDVNDGSLNDCPLVKSFELPVLPVCVNTAGLLPAHGPKVWVVGESPDTVSCPRGVGALSASMLAVSKV